MAAVLRVLAETQRELARSHSDNGPRRTRSLLSQVKLPEFDGATTTTTRRYREWRKGVEIVQNLNQLTNAELAAIVFSQVTGRAKTLIEIMEPEDLKKDDALETIYAIFDDAFEKKKTHHKIKLGTTWNLFDFNLTLGK